MLWGHMTEPVLGNSALVARAKAILTSPGTEWPVIAAETGGIAGLFTRYAAPLAAIPAVATFLHATIFGYRILGFTHRPPFSAALAWGVSSYVMSLLAVTLLAFVIDFLAPYFGGTSDRTKAFRLAIYSSTAAWVAGIFNLVPGLGFLTILGLYSLYLLYRGLHPLMQVPQEKGVPCTIAIGVVAVILMMLASQLAGPLSGNHMGSVPVVEVN